MVYRNCGWTCAIAAPEAFMVAGGASFTTIGYDRKRRLGARLDRGTVAKREQGARVQ